MAGFDANNWHNVNGGRIPFRAPTVDEALPYSPFTSVVPFSPDIIPYPVAEPPTPPTTLSSDQQSAARKAVGILNDEIEGPTSTAQHLEDTFRELRDLLGNPNDMTHFRFKPASQLATPPPDSATNQANDTTPTKLPPLSQFAELLLRQTHCVFQAEGVSSVQRPKANLQSSQQATPRAPAQTLSQPALSTPNRPPPTQNGTHQFPPKTPVSSSSSQPPRSGPAVLIPPSGFSPRKEEYRRYDHIPLKDSAQQKRDGRHEQDNLLATMGRQERDIAEQKIEQLNKFTQELQQEKEDSDLSDYFKKVSCLDSDIAVMRSKTTSDLYNLVMQVKAKGCFSLVPVETILRIHSLCEPSITALDQSSLFSLGDMESWSSDLGIADSGLKAANLALTTMLHGGQDRRITPEDLIIAIIECLKRVLESCIFPVLESRRTGDMSELFASASGHRDRMRSTILSCKSVLKSIAPLISKVALTHNAINPIEYIALALLVQQNSDSDKDSIFGIQRFESLRQAAMEVLTQVFAAHTDHQHSITSEILNNLEKLPDKGANARQFKSIRDQPIMSVSALFMRFVQVAATNQQNLHKKVISPSQHDETDGEDESDYASDESAPKKKKPEPKGDSSAKTVAQRLTSNAMAIASRIATVLTERAMNVSKSGDKPFRNLLDMFVEDFCNVLGSPEWPAATLLLQQLLLSMLRVLKTGNNIDMALTIMGSMACGIIDFKLRVKRLKRELDITQSELSARLDRLAEDALDNGIHKKDLLSFDGPYRMVIESLPDYLTSDVSQTDPRLLSIRGFYVSFWLNTVTQILQSSNDNDTPHKQAMSDLQGRLETIFTDPNYLSREYKFQTVSEVQSQLAAGIITLQDSFCQYQVKLFDIMLHHTRATSATLKSRAIKNIESFLDKDAQAIPQHLVMGVIGLLRDNSPLVRADAVSLVSKCLEGNPALEKHCLNNILSLTVDPSNGPKKKAINLLKKLYQSSSSSDHKLNIMASLLLPSQDHEKIIADLSRQALEDIWFKAADTKADDNKTKLQRIERAWLFVQLVRNIKGQVIKLEAFEKFFVAVLAGQALNVEANLRICKDLVADMVEGVISPDSMPVGCTQEHVLQSLSIFARIHPGLFSIDQLQLLEFYVKDPTTIDDLNILRPTATIFRFVLPRLPNLQADFGDKMFTPLTKVIPRVASWAAKGNADGKDTLQDVIHCQWVICPFVTNGIQRMIRLVRSIVTQLQPLASSTQEEMARSKNKIVSFLIIIGTVGKVCNFDNHHADMFCKMMTEMGVNVMLDSERTSEKGPKGDLKSAAPSVIMLETVRLFTKQPWELSVRNHALCSVGEICQGSPSLFMRTPVEATFKLVFKNDVESLKRIALSQFHDFFVRAERRSDSDTLGSASQDVAEGTGPLGITFVAGDNQVTTNWLARRFLQEVVDVALKMEEELALIATIIITSVSRQGLVHPKECGAALIALGTSPNTQIAQSAAIEHKKIHDAHESIFEKEYMAATRMAFEYQREVYKDPHGMVASTFKPKMLHVFNVLKGGNRKTLKKFIDNFCKQMNFDLPKLADPEIGATTLLYTRFCLENLALFDVPKLEDVAIMTNALENIVMKLTGPLVGVAIDTEVPKAVVPGPQFEDYPPAELGAETIAPALGNGEAEERLLQLTRACTILQMMWETRGFIRKAYNLHNTTGRILHKDYQKPAQRNNFVSGKELRERLESVYSTDDSREAMVKRCLEFAELLEIDKDAQFGEQDGEDEDGGYVTPDEAADAAPTIPTSGRGRKRKSSASISNTPKKQRGRPPGTKNKKRNSKTPDLGGWD